ncbi:FkbM family methyltransferase [Conexibacter sp. W3-3-2]|uniref:FkbM family methyltransferase n=1 Tax=Conexibacter sp. W3-3-2 TaxID=2675227 RepID=UPI0012B8B337|nr:FkbM family methyltransferase [Conexibacter sp. W3-3-2]MTD45769.1 FkbM family methyltransferase [Conexibacter sp. W3-3-2]
MSATPEIAKARVRELLLRAADRAGLEVRRRGRGVRRTLTEVLEHYAALGVAPATLVDVGVAAGTPVLYDAFPHARRLLVEPLREWEPTLRDLVAAAPTGSAYELCAAGPQPGELEIGVHRVLACSSMVGDRAGDGADVERRVVPVRRLDDVVAAHGLDDGRPVVLKADVEGAELEVLKGAPATLERTQLVLLEVSLFALNPGGAQLAEVVGWMAEHGWAVADLYDGHVRPLDGQLAQIDIAFTREDGPLRADHRYARPEQADALYRSWGL